MASFIPVPDGWDWPRESPDWPLSDDTSGRWESWGPPPLKPCYVNKRSIDELDSNDATEPASKRPALSTRLDDMSPQDDIDMGDTHDICSSSSGKHHVPSPTLQHSVLCEEHEEVDGWGPVSSAYFYWASIHEHIKESLCKETGGSYWYRMPSSGQQESLSPSTFYGKRIQDMGLFPDKTFFHINEMINAKKCKFFGLDATFELFARVVHTGCGVSPPGSFQCFKLEDLFSGQPYMSGIMMFKKKESPIYCESSPFLAATKTEDKCYCLCEVIEDDRSELGWSLYIHDIQPVTWETIRSVHANMGKEV